MLDDIRDLEEDAVDEGTAFQQLGLPLTASEAEITDRFRALALEHHPDTGGDATLMAELSVARDVALAAIRNRALVPISAIRDLVRATEQVAIERQERAEASRKTVRHIVRYHASRMKRFKRTAAFFGSVSAALAAITSKLIPVLQGTALDSPAMATAFTVMALAAGFCYWFFSSVAEDLERSIEDAAEVLDDKGNLLDVLEDVLDVLEDVARRSGEPLPWTRRALEHAVALWARPGDRPRSLELPLRVRSLLGPTEVSMERIARRIGPRDFTKMLVTKALEHRLLDERQTFSGGRVVLHYALTVTPPKEVDNSAGTRDAGG